MGLSGIVNKDNSEDIEEVKTGCKIANLGFDRSLVEPIKFEQIL